MAKLKDFRRWLQGEAVKGMPVPWKHPSFPGSVFSFDQFTNIKPRWMTEMGEELVSGGAVLWVADGQNKTLWIAYKDGAQDEATMASFKMFTDWAKEYGELVTEKEVTKQLKPQRLLDIKMVDREGHTKMIQCGACAPVRLYLSEEDKRQAFGDFKDIGFVIEIRYAHWRVS